MESNRKGYHSRDIPHTEACRITREKVSKETIEEEYYIAAIPEGVLVLARRIVDRLHWIVAAFR